jgi:trk system potassium uptake protein TrkH
MDRMVISGQSRESIGKRRYRYLQRLFEHFNPAQILVFGFAGLILLGTCLLMLPISSRAGLVTPFLSALFTATSAVCVTGLVVVDTGTHYSIFGQLVILLLIQMGGLGIMTMATLFALIVGKKINLRERLIMQEALNAVSVEGIVRLTKNVLKMTFIIEGIGAVILALRFYYDLGLGKGLYFGFFHSISSFCNAGFDLFGSVYGPFSSITAYKEDPIVSLTVSTLIILGGL